MCSHKCSCLLLGFVTVLTALTSTGRAGDLVTIEGTLATRGGVSLSLSAVCSKTGGMIVVREPEEYCGRGLLWLKSGERHEYVPMLRRVRRLSDTEWRTTATWDTRLPPAKVFDVVCGGQASRSDSALFARTSRNDASTNDSPSMAALLAQSGALSCSVAPSLKMGGASHEKSGLTVRDDRSSLVVVSWIDPMGPCGGRTGSESIELTQRGPDGRVTCVGQFGTAPAALAGISVGDVVLRVDRTMVTKATDVARLLDAENRSVDVLMYRGDITTVDASGLRASASGRACEGTGRAHGATPGFYCWKWNPAVATLRGDSAPGAGVEPAAKPESARPREAEPSDEQREQKYEAFFKENGCPGCDEAAHLNETYLTLVKAKGCDLSKCARVEAATTTTQRSTSRSGEELPDTQAAAWLVERAWHAHHRCDFGSWSIPTSELKVSDDSGSTFTAHFAFDGRCSATAPAVKEMLVSGAHDGLGGTALLLWLSATTEHGNAWSYAPQIRRVRALPPWDAEWLVGFWQPTEVPAWAQPLQVEVGGFVRMGEQWLASVKADGSTPAGAEVPALAARLAPLRVFETVSPRAEEHRAIRWEGERTGDGRRTLVIESRTPDDRLHTRWIDPERGIVVHDEIAVPGAQRVSVERTWRQTRGHWEAATWTVRGGGADVRFVFGALGSKTPADASFTAERLVEIVK